MKPSELSKSLTRIAMAIDFANNPDRRLVTRDLEALIAAVEPGTPRKAGGFNLISGVNMLAAEISLVELEGIEKIFEQIENALEPFGYDVNDHHSFISASSLPSGFSLQIMPKDHDVKKAVGMNEIGKILNDALGLRRGSVEVEQMESEGYFRVSTRGFEWGLSRGERSRQLKLGL